MADGPLTALPNLRCRTDANGYLLVTVSGGAITPTTVKTNSVTLDVANGDIVLWRSAAKSLQIDTDGAGGALTAVAVTGPLTVTGVITAGGASGSFSSAGGGYLSNSGGAFSWSSRSLISSPANGQINLNNNNSTSGVGLDVTTDGTLKLMNRAQTAAANLSFLKATSYNGVATAGQGMPSIYAANFVSGTTGTIASLASYVVGAADGDFEVSGSLLITASSTHAITMVCAYTDPGGTARSKTMSFELVAGGALVTVATAANGTVPYHGNVVHIRAKQTTTINMLTTGTVTSVTYNAGAAIRQLQ